jgi:hypothetical protein
MTVLHRRLRRLEDEREAASMNCGLTDDEQRRIERCKQPPEARQRSGRGQSPRSSGRPNCGWYRKVCGDQLPIT